MSSKLSFLHSSLPENLLKKQVAPALPFGSGIASLDQWLDGGLAWGKFSEWGMPLGSDTRKLLLNFLKKANCDFLWVYSPKMGSPYPASWASQIDLNRAYFIESDRPVADLKSCFLDNTFRLIILDSPQFLSLGDLAFLNQQCRSLKQHYFLLRPYYLSNKLGNAYAQYRINVFKEEANGYILKKQKGIGEQSSLHLPMEEVVQHERSSSFL
ncbi:MAG: hypothetical protein VX583_14895 [Bdellovibrionota bacterium]|nr:hypothetical protein [Pseudobdellovibrionaceae bacterium]|tara:strand:- start:44310 stop:44945 length:636 start_codon:yes stop_codon:yes gene_type:complete